MLCTTIYLDTDSHVIKAVIIHSDKLGKYYLLSNTSQAKWLQKGGNVLTFKIELKNDSNQNEGRLIKQFEKKLKGVELLSREDEEIIKNQRYSEYRVYDDVTSSIKVNEIPLVKYSYDKTNMFSTDLIDSINKVDSIYKIVNKEEIDSFDKIFSLEQMSKKRSGRNDHFYFDKEKRLLKFFIFSVYLSKGPRYYLFENLGDKVSFKFLRMTDSVRALIKQIEDEYYVVPASKEQLVLRGRIKYEDYLEIVKDREEIEEQESINKQIEAEFKEIVNKDEKEVVNDIKDIDSDLDEFKKYITEVGGVVENGLIYFPDYEDFPIAAISKYEISIRNSRFPNNNDIAIYSRNKYKRKDKEIKNRIVSLLIGSSSSRINALKTIIERVKDYNFTSDTPKEVIDIFNHQIAAAFFYLWSSDYNDPNEYELIQRYREYYEGWKKEYNAEDISLENVEEDEIELDEEPAKIKKEAAFIDKNLYILGQIPRGSKSLIKAKAEEFGFDRKRIFIYLYDELEKLDIDMFKSDHHLRESVLIIGQWPHKTVGTGKRDSVQAKLKAEANDFPPFAICTIGNSETPAPITQSRLEKLLIELGFTKIENC